jgi:hypothetical protein
MVDSFIKFIYYENMDIDTLKLTDDDRNYLEQYCSECSGSYFSKLIKAMLLFEKEYPRIDIENILSLKIGYINRLIKIYSNYGLKKLLEEDINNRYKIYFSVKEHGWIDLFFEFRNLTVKINLSGVFDPIPDLLQFINKINNDEEFIVITIDEEGKYKRIQLNNIDTLKKKLYELTIVADGYPYNEYKMRITGLFTLRRLWAAPGFTRLGRCAPTPRSATLGRAVLLRKPLYARPNVVNSRNDK